MMWTWPYALFCLFGLALFVAARIARCLTSPRYEWSDAFLCSRVKTRDWHVEEEAKVIPCSDEGAIYGQKETAIDAFLYAGNHDTTPFLHNELTS